jgi:hypothetical protein
MASNRMPPSLRTFAQERRILFMAQKTQEKTYQVADLVVTYRVGQIIQLHDGWQWQAAEIVALCENYIKVRYAAYGVGTLTKRVYIHNFPKRIKRVNWLSKSFGIAALKDFADLFKFSEAAVAA